jgi:hypothetical protein
MNVAFIWFPILMNVYQMLRWDYEFIFLNFGEHFLF